MGELTLGHFLAVSALLFVIGMLGVLTRRNILIIFMSVEMMLNAVVLSFVAFGRFLDSLNGQVFGLFIVAVAAAEAAIGLGLVMLLARRQDTVDVTSVSLLKE